jgi:YHS domain-containing protein
MTDHQTHPTHDTQNGEAPAEVLDPVCGMTISPADAVGHVEYAGLTYYFCAESCLEQFKDAPERFLNPDRAVAPAAHETLLAHLFKLQEEQKVSEAAGVWSLRGGSEAGR